MDRKIPKIPCVICDAVEQEKESIISFAQELVRIQSVTGAEGEVAKSVARKMRELNYDKVIEDSAGNVLGIVGSGETKILFDSHMDTVEVTDASAWTYPPFGGEIHEGRLYGRGAVDMKGSLAVTVYVGAVAKRLGLLDGKTLYISASTLEEDYDGEMVARVLREWEIRPDHVIIGEATDLNIGYGHRGRAFIKNTVNGRATHGSKPELGINPVYTLQHVIGRIEILANFLDSQTKEKGSVAITRIGCVTASDNSVPDSAYIILDRRLSIQENMDTIRAEMEEVCRGVDGAWEICDVPGVSWTGVPVTLHSYLPAWEISMEEKLVKKAREACRTVLGREVICFKPGYSTNAAVTAGIFHIPTIILGPGDMSVAHRTDEYCEVKALLQACEIYLHLCEKL